MVGLSDGSAISGQKKSVHTIMNVNSHRIAAAGRAAGTATVRNVRNIEQPSIRAASISSSGTASTRYCRMKKTPNAVTSHGSDRPPRCCRPSPSSAITTNIGTTPSWVGTAMVAMMNAISADVAAEPELGEGVAGQRREAHDRGRRDRRDEQAVGQRLPERHRVEHPLGVVEEVPAGQQRRGALGGDRRGVRAEQERPVERRGRAEHERDQQPVDEEPGPAVHRPPLGRSAGWPGSCASANTTMIRNSSQAVADAWPRSRPRPQP